MSKVLTAVLATAVFFSAPPADGAEWSAVLVSGGGTPASNAVAHEKNIRFVQRTLRAAGLRPADVRAYVSVGAEPFADTSYLVGVPAARWEIGLLDRLFGTGGVDLAYRHHGVTDAAGPARRAAITQSIEAQARALRGGRTLLLYATDHGRRNEANVDDSFVVLWGKEELSVNDVRGALEPQRGGRVVGVFAQCFSGSFANMIYDQPRKLSPQDRCGFFATPPERESAGCTPEIEEENYDDYTTRVFAALSGVERTGRRVSGFDYDRDGAVSFAEAHAYAVGSEETIDVPTKTSEFYLERRGVKPAGAWRAARDVAPAPERAAWTLVAARLKLDAGADPGPRLRAAQLDVRKRIEAAHKKLDAVDGKLQSDEEVLRQALLERWPVLGSPYHPQFAATLGDGTAVRAFLAGNPAFARWKNGTAEYNAAAEELGRLQVDDAWLLRADRLRTHILRLATAASSPSISRDLARLQACEASVPGR